MTCRRTADALVGVPTPMGIDETVPVITRTDTTINAPVARNWQIQTDVDR